MSDLTIMRAVYQGEVLYNRKELIVYFETLQHGALRQKDYAELHALGRIIQQLSNGSNELVTPGIAHRNFTRIVNSHDIRILGYDKTKNT